MIKSLCVCIYSQKTVDLTSMKNQRSFTQFVVRRHKIEKIQSLKRLIIMKTYISKHITRLSNAIVRAYSFLSMFIVHFINNQLKVQLP